MTKLHYLCNTCTYNHKIDLFGQFGNAILADKFVYMNCKILFCLQIELDTDHENFMDPWQAKDYGLVDAVINDGKPGLIAPTPAPTGPPQINEWALRNLPSLVKPTLAPIGPPETSDLGLQT